MSIFSLLRSHSSHSSARLSNRGFTLVELIISSAIIVFVTALIVFNQAAFDGATILRSSGYDVASVIREAQIYSVGAMNTEPSGTAQFRYPYGLSFSPGATSFTLFRYQSTSNSAFPAFGVSDGVAENIVRINYLSGSNQINDLCVTVSGVDNCNVNRLDISFRRPEYAALIYADPLGSSEAVAISAAKIKLESSRRPGKIVTIEVRLLGQVTVSEQ